MEVERVRLPCPAVGSQKQFVLLPNVGRVIADYSENKYETSPHETKCPFIRP